MLSTDAVGCRAEGAHQELPWIRQAHRLGFNKLARRAAKASVEGGGTLQAAAAAAAACEAGVGAAAACEAGFSDSAAASASATGRQHSEGAVNSRLNDT